MTSSRLTRPTGPARHTRPTWAEVSRSQLIHNYDMVRRLAGPETEVLAVVKANAYGHGLAGCARALEGGGAQWLGVTSVEEGVALRGICAEARILIMSGIWAGEADAAVEYSLTPVVWEAQHLEWLEEAARGRGLGAGAVPVHLEIDTGMSRQGVQPKCLEALLGRSGPDSPVRVEAVMTHFHSPGNAELTAEQNRTFVTAVDTIIGCGVRPGILSAGSSAGTLQRDAAVADLAKRMDARLMLRAGIALYGYAPDPEETGESARQLKPALEWKTRVISLREVEAGTVVGYDATFRADRRTRLALLPVGYADGLNRLLSNRGEVLVRGQRAPVAGRISMDHTTVDVTDVSGVAVGDEVVLIGEQGEERLTAADMAKLTGTISYEVLCDIGARVPRTMVE
ncbi:MAG: alanine racemase [Acidobacteriaceae bacterium]